MALRIIFVHGISSSIITGNYSEKLAAMIQSSLAKKIKSIDENFSLEGEITFENVNYSSVAQNEEDDLLQKYLIDSRKEYNLLDKILEKLVYGSVRKELITSVSDVLIYESSFWRDRIRDTVRLAVEKYAAANDQVTVIAHSLGTVVSFDTLYYNSRHNPNWLMNQFKPKNFYTMGSPIALFSLEMDDAIGNQKPRYVSAADQPADMGDISFIQKDGEWINFFDAQDLIGYPLETLFKDKFSVMDQIVNTGFLPLSSHLKYCENKDIAEKISSKLFYDITNNQVNIKI